MKFNETITLHGVTVALSGRWERAEPATYDYPGSGPEVRIDTATVGGVEVLSWLESADWMEEAETHVLEALIEPIEL